MVPVGSPVVVTLENIKKYAKKIIVIDGTNTHYKESQKHACDMKKIWIFLHRLWCVGRNFR